MLAKLGRDGEAARALAEAKRLRPQLSAREVRMWGGRGKGYEVPGEFVVVRGAKTGR